MSQQPAWVRKHANKWVETALKYVASDPRSPGWHPADLVNEAAKKLRPTRPIDLSQSEMWCDVPTNTTPEEYVATVLAAMSTDSRVSSRVSASGKKVFVSTSTHSVDGLGSTAPSTDPTAGRWVPAHAEHWAGVASRFVEQDSDSRKRYYTADIINNAGRALQASVRPSSYTDVPEGITIDQYMAKITRLMPRYADIQLGEDDRGRQYFVKRRGGQGSAVVPPLGSPGERGGTPTPPKPAGQAAPGRWAAVAATAPAEEASNLLHAVFPGLPALMPRAPVQPIVVPEWVREHAEHWTGVALRFIDQPHNTNRRYYIQDVIHNSATALASRANPAYSNVPKAITGPQYVSAVLAYMKKKGEVEVSQDDRGRQYLTRKKPSTSVPRPTGSLSAARRPSDAPSVSSTGSSVALSEHKGAAGSSTITSPPSRPAAPAAQPAQHASAAPAPSSALAAPVSRIAVDTSEPAWVTAHSGRWSKIVLAFLQAHPEADGWPIAQLFESANNGLGPATLSPEVGTQYSPTGVLQPAPRLRDVQFKDVPSHITPQQYFSTIVSRIAQHEEVEVRADKDGMPHFGLRPGGVQTTRQEASMQQQPVKEGQGIGASTGAFKDASSAAVVPEAKTGNHTGSGASVSGWDASLRSLSSSHPSLWGAPGSTNAHALPSSSANGEGAVPGTAASAAPAPPGTAGMGSSSGAQQEDPMDQVALSIALRGFDPASPANIFSRTPGNMGQLLRHSAASFHATGVGAPFPGAPILSAGPGTGTTPRTSTGMGTGMGHMGLGGLPSLGAGMGMSVGAGSPMAGMYASQSKAMELMLAALSVQSPHLGLRAPGLPFSMASAMQAMQGMGGVPTPQAGGIPATQPHASVLASGAGATTGPARPVAPLSMQALQAEALAARSLAQAQASRALTLAVHALENSHSAEDAASARAAIDAARSALEIVALTEAHVSLGQAGAAMGPAKSAPSSSDEASLELKALLQGLDRDKTAGHA